MENDFDSISRQNWYDLRDGTPFQQPKPDPLPYTAIFYGLKSDEGVKFEALAKYLVNSWYDKTLIFRYTDYVAPTVYESVPLGYPWSDKQKKDVPFAIFTYIDDNGREVTGRLTGKLNHRIDFIDNKNWAQNIVIDFGSRVVRGDLLFYYINTKDKRNYNRESERFDIDDKYLAIQLSSNNLTDYAYLINYIQGERSFDFIKEEIAKTFANKIMVAYKPAELNFLYENIPDLIIPYLKSYISSKRALRDLLSLKKYDDDGTFSFLVDSSSALINLLRIVGDSQLIYDTFKSNPKLVKDLYYNFDGTVESNEGIVKSRTAFANFLCALCKYHGFDGFIKDINPDEDEQKFAEFYLSEYEQLDSNVDPDSDTDPNKIFLKQTRAQALPKTKPNQESGLMVGGMILIEEESPVFEDVDMGLYFHPLTPVYLTVGEGKNKERYLVPAIFVKSISDEAEWKEINKNLRIGLDIFAIIVGVATLGTASPLLIALSALDVGVAAADIIVAVEEDELMKTPEGRAFLETWNKIVLVGGILTAGPLLINGALKNSTRLLNAVTTFTKPETILFLKSVVQKLTIAKIVNASSKLVAKVILTAEEFWLLIKREIYLAKLKTLKKAGCIFTVIKDKIGKIAGYVVTYMGEVIAQGTAKQLNETLKQFYNLPIDDLISRLDDYIDIEEFTKLKRFQNILKEVIADSKLLKFLTAEEEAVIRYYTGPSFEELNSALRGLSELTLELYGYKVLLNRALNKLPNSIYNGKKLYRSVEFSEEMITEIKKNKIYIDDGFLSSSYDYKKFIENWLKPRPKHNVLFEIEGKNGKLVAETSTTDEAEILFKTRTKFKVMSVTEVDHPAITGKKIIKIILNEL